MNDHSPAFDRYVGIDYSGAKTPTDSLKGLRVYVASVSDLPVEMPPPPSPRKYWTRRCPSMAFYYKKATRVVQIKSAGRYWIMAVLWGMICISPARVFSFLDATGENDAPASATDEDAHTTYQERQRQTMSNVHPWGAYVNLTAPGWLGLTVAVERGFRFKTHTIAPGIRIRSLNLGWVAYELPGDDSTFQWGLGSALGCRIYLTRGPGLLLRGVYVGVWAEYFHAAGKRPAYTWDVGGIGPQAEFGYRWRRNRFLIGVGISGGFFARFFNTRRYWNDYRQSVDDSYLFPNFGLDFEMGWTF